MQNRYSYLILFLLLVPFVVISCVKKEPPDKENPDFNEKVDLKPKEPKRAVFVYINPSSGSTEGGAERVFVPAGTDVSQTIAVGSESFYDWVEDVKKRLAREKLESANEDCVLMEKIARNNPEHLDFEAKLDLKCVDVNTQEPSHTDPSPLDDVDQWVLCQPTDSGPGSSGPGGDPSGGGPGAGPGAGPADPGISPGGDSGDGSEDDAGSGSDVVDAMAQLICTPAVRVNPGVDPRLIYPAPDQVEAVVANIAPCVDDFCPFEIIFDVPELEDPTDPIDPSQDEPEELTEDIKGQLMCDEFRGLCEPDITLISKNDLARDDDDDEIEGDPKGNNCDDKCDGVCNKADGTSNPGEDCTHGPVDSKEKEWIKCSGTEIATGSICIHHKKDEDTGDSVYTVTHGNGVAGGRVSLKEQLEREQEADDAVAPHHNLDDCERSSINAPRDQYSSSFTYTCSN